MTRPTVRLECHVYDPSKGFIAMSTAKNLFVFVETKGGETVETPLSSDLIPFAARLLPLATASEKSRAAMDLSNRAMAEIFVELRKGYKYTPRTTNPAVSDLHELAAATLVDAGITVDFNDKGKYVIPAGDIDWNGKSPECSKAERQIWASILLHKGLARWMAATGYTVSNHPMVGAVAFHIDNVVKAQFSTPADYVLATGKVFETPGKERKEALKALKDLAGSSNPGGETNVSAATAATTAAQSVPAALASVRETLESLSLKGLKGAARVSARNELNAIALWIELNRASVAEVVRTKSDPRRVRAADATS